MIGLLAPVVLAIVVGLLLGGSLAAWSRAKVHWWPLAVGALLAQLVLFNPPLDQKPWIQPWGHWLWVLSLVVVFAVLVRNATAAGRRQALPWVVAALGLGLNLLVVTANGGTMPQLAEARAATRDSPTDPPLVADRLRSVQPMGPETRLPWLADVIPQPAWLPRANVVSVGDLLLAFGMAGWALQTTLATRKREPRLEHRIRAL